MTKCFNKYNKKKTAQQQMNQSNEHAGAQHDKNHFTADIQLYPYGILCLGITAILCRMTHFRVVKGIWKITTEVYNTTEASSLRQWTSLILSFLSGDALPGHHGRHLQVLLVRGTFT